MIELKPCLYCNRSAATIKQTVRAGRICWYVECSCGLASTPQSVESDAPKAWNALVEIKGMMMADRDTINNLVAILQRIVDEEQKSYDRSYRAAADTNNMDSVGIHFDYAPYLTLPEWFEEAKVLIARAKGGSL